MTGRCFALALFALLLLSLVVPVGLSAAEEDTVDPSKYLTDTEKAYVARLTAAYASSRAALDELSGEIGGAAFGALMGGDTPKPTEMAMKVISCKGTLAAQAAVFRETPPDSMTGLGSTNTAIATRLEGSFGPTMAIIWEEGKKRAVDYARETLGGALAGALGLEASPETNGTALKARFVAGVMSEISDLKALLDAGQGALNARVAEIAEQAKEDEEAMWDFLLGDCFIATAAYGTATAAEINVLRSFRDRVLLMSPAGRDYIDFYYAASPPIADFIARHEALRTVVREGVVDPIVYLVSRFEPLWQPA